MDSSFRNELLFVFQMLQGVGQVAAAIIALYAVHLVQAYTRKRDQADFIRSRWSEQAQLNLLYLENEGALDIHEEIVYGRKMADRRRAKKFFILFSMLNQVQHLFIASQHGVLDKLEFEKYALQALRLIKREQPIVNYLLTQRGYSEDFAQVVLGLIDRVEPSEAPSTFDDNKSRIPRMFSSDWLAGILSIRILSNSR